MAIDTAALDQLIAKDAIRELALLYARGVDRKDGDLLRTLYTGDATDSHGNSFDGKAEDYVDFLEKSFPYMRYSGHHICNHLISVDGDVGDGEVYAMALHVIPDRSGGWLEDFMTVRYVDNYRKESDGRWRFARRIVTYDFRTIRPYELRPETQARPEDPTYQILSSRLFARGPRD
jgi:ketosteroid isomerase-like protein